MNAINHAATALAINRRWPGVPLVPTLIAVQLVEMLWVVLNLAGIEHTEIGPVFDSMRDLHLVDMPYSHSILSSALLALAVGVGTAWLTRRPAWAVALGVGVFSHTVLDLLVHNRDIALAPGWAGPKLGTGLYDEPMLALALETLYGVACWRYFRGSGRLLAVILAFNLGSLSFYSAAIPGPELWLAGHPKWFAAMIGLHIVLGLAAVGWFARTRWRSAAAPMAQVN